MKINFKKDLNKKTKIWLVFWCTVVIILTGLYIFVSSKNSGQTISNDPLTYSADKPDETKPGNDFIWNGAADDPKYIDLPTIGAGGYIQKVGVDQNQQIAVPSNIHIAGWFVDSVKPAQLGLSIIDGHVDGWTSEGIFKKLYQLKQQDRFTVETGEGKKYTFEVKEIKEVKASESASILFSQNPSIKNQLNLVTCGGKFDAATKQYENRIIAVSELVN